MMAKVSQLTSKIGTAVTLFGIALLAFVLLSSSVGNNGLLSAADSQKLKVAVNGTSSIATTQQGGLSLIDIFKQAHDSVVQITTTTNPSNPNNTQTTVNGKPVQNQSADVNAGFIFDNNGHILTTASVQGANPRAEITFADGNIYSANVIGKDIYSDLAVLQLDKSALSQEKIQPLPILSNSSTLQVGQAVAIIGNPFGLFPSLTTGIISGLNRLAPIPNTGFSIPGAIQLNGIINHGDSGPVLNLDGKVIGSMALIFSGDNGTFTGINFAVPSNTIQKIVPQLIAHGSYKHPWLGINGRSITPDIATAAGLKQNQTKGVIVASISPGSPAEKAGIKNGTESTTRFNGQLISTNGDIVVGVDGKQVRNIDDIVSYIDTAKSVGDTVVLKVLRNGVTQNIDVKLTERPIADSLSGSNITSAPMNVNNNSTSITKSR